MAWTKAMTPGMSKCDSMDIVGGKRMKQSHLSRRRKRSKKRRWGLSNWIIKVPLITQFSPCEQVGVKVQGWRWGKFWSCFVLSNGYVQVAAFSRHSGIWIWRSRDNVTDCVFKNGHYFPPPHASEKWPYTPHQERQSNFIPLTYSWPRKFIHNHQHTVEVTGNTTKIQVRKGQASPDQFSWIVGLQTPTHGT